MSTTHLFVAVNNASYTTWYSQSAEVLTELANPGFAGTQVADFSTDGVYLVTRGSGGGASGPKIYKRTADSLALLTTNAPNIPPTDFPVQAKFSLDGTYLAFGTDSGTKLWLYKRTGDQFFLLSQPNTQPTGVIKKIEFSPNGLRLAVRTDTSPYLFMYSIDSATDTFTLLGALGTMPATGTSGIAFTTDSIYMAISSSGSLLIYKWSGSAYVYLTSVATGATAVYGCSFSPDDIYLAYHTNTSPYVGMLKRTGDSFATTGAPGAYPTTAQSLPAIAWSNDSVYLYVAASNSPYLYVYRKVGDTLVKQANPASPPLGPVQALAVNPPAVSYNAFAPISGVVLDSLGAPTSRTVFCQLESSKNLVQVVTSDPTTGAFAMSGYNNSAHIVTCFDATENSLTFAHVIPTA